MNIKKNMFFIALASFTSCMAFAGLNPNAYFGFGGDLITSHVNLNTTNRDNGFSVTQSTRPDAFMAHIFGGLGFVTNGFYWGGEIGTYQPSVAGTITRPGVSLTNQTFQNRVNLQNYVTVDFTPGVKVNNKVLVYTHIGYALSEFGFSQVPTSNVFGFANDKDLSGLRLGVSGDYAITDNFSAGADLIFTTYEAFHSQFPSTFNIGFSSKPYTTDVGLHLKYNLPV